MPEEKKYYCMCCGEELGYTPKYCCNAFDCGCQGLPVDPPICSQECYEKLESERERT